MRHSFSSDSIPEGISCPLPPFQEVAWTRPTLAAPFRSAPSPLGSLQGRYRRPAPTHLQLSALEADSPNPAISGAQPSPRFSPRLSQRHRKGASQLESSESSEKGAHQLETSSRTGFTRGHARGFAAGAAGGGRSHPTCRTHRKPRQGCQPFRSVPALHYWQWAQKRGRFYALARAWRTSRGHILRPS